MARGKAFTQAEDDIIRMWVDKGKPVAQLAKTLGRGRSTIYLRISNMNANGTLEQGVMDLGQDLE